MNFKCSAMEKKELCTTPMMVEYQKTKEQYPDYLLFYRMGDFYEMFFEDAKKAAKALDINLTHRGKYMDTEENVEKPIPMCGVPYHAYESYMAKLVKNGFKVAICEQMESPELAKKQGRTVRRDIIRLVTPGTLSEDILLDSKKHNYLLVAVNDGAQMGMVWADMSTGDFFAEVVPVQKFISVLARLTPAEIVLPDYLVSHPELKRPLMEYQDKLTIFPDAKFSYMNAKERLEKQFGVQTLEAFGAFTRAELTAGGVLVDYLTLTQKGDSFHLKNPVRLTQESMMEIDPATRRSLELFYSLSGDRRAQSLYNVMDKTLTNPGARLFAEYLSAPLTNAAKINNRLDAVGFFLEDFDTRGKVRELFKDFPDIDRAISRLSLGRGGPRELQSLRDALKKVPYFYNCLMKCILPELLTDCLNDFGKYDVLVDKLERALADTVPLLARDGNFIRSGYHTQLDELRSVQGNEANEVKKLTQKYINQTGISSLKINNNSIIGHYIEVPARFAPQIMQDTALGFIHRQTLVNNVRYVTVELTQLDNRIRGSHEQILEIELGIFQEFVTEIMNLSEQILKTSRALAIVDVMSSLAELAQEKNYVRPVVDDSLAFNIQSGRHPVVEESLKKSRVNFAPNDCCLGDSKGRLWLLTGPNMAGKSTFLRQNALIAIMAQMGSFVPANAAHIGIVDKVFSRVGASDDLARGQSTFMVEMVETSTILNQATEKSLVILDEIGRGTATFDGLSIAWAVAEYLHDQNRCRALFATHYHELVALKETLSELTLHTMKIKEWNDEVVFLHTVAEGSVDKSYGIHVGKLAGLPKAVLKRAEQILASLESEKQKTKTLADDLPLFSSVLHKEAEPEKSPVEKELMFINPDAMTPRDALDVLYKLKGMLDTH